MRIAMLAAAALLLALAVPLRAGEQNLLPNGDFGKGLARWKVTFPEANETKYSRNHDWITVVDSPGGGGKAVRFVLSEGVAASEGVKAVTEMVEIDPAGAYEFGADVFTRGPTLKMFIEGYVKEPKQQVAGNDMYPGFVRVYRASIHVRTGPEAWSTQRRVFDLSKAPKANRPTHVLVKIYAYWPKGEAFYRNVFLRPAAAGAASPPH